VLLLLNLSTANARDWKHWSHKDRLPKVLIIGDSIAMGYTPYVQSILTNKATVMRQKGNARSTRNGLKKLDRWIGNTTWDVIHFNWGLWDICSLRPDSVTQEEGSMLDDALRIPKDQYEKNLEELVVRLKKSGKKLIWAQTTVVPGNKAGRIVGREEEYNDLAIKVMKKHGVLINDLHFLTEGFTSDLFVNLDDVHYTPVGYQRIAEQVADKILLTLGGEQKSFQ